MDTRTHHQANRAAWNQAAHRYEQQIAMDIVFLRAGGKHLMPPELRSLGILAPGVGARSICNAPAAATHCRCGITARRR